MVACKRGVALRPLIVSIVVLAILSIAFVLSRQNDPLHSPVAGAPPRATRPGTTVEQHPPARTERQLQGQHNRDAVESGYAGLEVYTTSEDSSQQLSGVDIYVRSTESDDLLLCGQTDPAGFHHIGPELLAFAERVIAIADGYAPSEAPLYDELSRTELHLQLRQSYELTGRVVDSTGHPVGAGIRVSGWRTEHWPNIYRLASAVARSGSDPSIPLASTDSSGEFRLFGLEADTSYTLAAAGNGFASQELVNILVTAESDGSLIELTVVPLFGAVLRMTDESGNVITNAGTSERSTAGSSLQLMDPAASRVSDSRLLVLAGVDPDAIARGGSANGAVFRTKSGRDGASAGPVDFFVSLAGYKPYQAHFLLPRCRGEVPIIDVRMERLPGVVFGELEVTLHKGGYFDGSLVGHQSRKVIGALSLERTDGIDSGAIYWYELNSRFNRPQLLTGVPVGVYVAHARFDPMCHWPDSEKGSGQLISVAESDTRLDIDLTTTSALQLTLIDQHGVRVDYDGAICIMITDVAASRRVAFGLGKPPFVAPVFKEGTYDIKVRLDAESRFGGRYHWLPGSTRVVVNAGLLTAASIVLPSPR